MDTISLKINLNTQKDLTVVNFSFIQSQIENFKSRFGFRYVDCGKSDETKLIVKISYPRYFKNHNGFLITKISECLEVNNDFVEQIKSLGIEKLIKSVEPIRIDIPFTFYMKPDETFASYFKIFKIMNEIYAFDDKSDRKGTGIIDMKNSDIETVYYTDTKTIGNYNSKVVVYNQNLNLKEKYSKANENQEWIYNKAIKDFPDLEYRLRIEVSKRVQKVPISLEEFSKWDIFSSYCETFKKYALDNVFDLDILNKVIEKQANKLMNFYNFNKDYEYYTYKELISDYYEDVLCFDSLKLMVNKLYDDINTIHVYNHRIRKRLTRHEKNKNIIILNAVKKLKEMRESVENFFPKR